MKVFSRGRADRITVDELKFATRYMYGLLVGQRVFDTTQVMLDIRSPTKEEKRLGMEGLTFVYDEGYSPRNFRVVLNSGMPRKRSLLALGHELVHVGQFATGELYAGADTQYKFWKRKLVNENELCYWDLPWEIEAHGRQEGLFARYSNHLRNNKIKFPRSSSKKA